MSKDMYFKYKRFLIEHELFDELVFNFIRNNSVLINYKKIDEFKSFKCSVVVDEYGILVDVIPCVPFLKNDEMVAINIFIYVQTLLLIPNIGRYYDERYYSDLFPLIFQKLYILENKNYTLLEYEKKMLINLFKEVGMNYNDTIQNKEILVASYNKDKNILNNSVRKIKQRARSYLQDNNN